MSGITTMRINRKKIWPAGWDIGYRPLKPPSLPGERVG